LASHHHASFVNFVFDGSGVDRRPRVIGARLVRPFFSLPGTYVYCTWTSPFLRDTSLFPRSHRVGVVTVDDESRSDIGASFSFSLSDSYLCTFCPWALFLSFRGVPPFSNRLLPTRCFRRFHSHFDSPNFGRAGLLLGA
jgi:hypothetical protein